MSVEESTLPTSRTWAVDPMHSTVGFSLKHHAVGTFRSRFKEFEAEFDAAAGKLRGSANAASIDSFDMLNEHLLSEDFFDAAKHPTITFESTSIEQNGDELVVAGDLTFRGVTKPITAKGTIIGSSKVAGWEGAPDSEHIGIDLETTIDRRDFGLEFNNELLSGQLNLGWDVTLEFSLEFVTEAE